MPTAKLGQCSSTPGAPPAPILGTPTVSGNSVTVPVSQCQAGATVVVTASNGATQSFVCGAGNSVTFAGLANGNYTFTATQSANGLTSALSNQVNATVNQSSGPQNVVCSVVGDTVSWVVSGAGSATQLQVRATLDPNSGPWTNPPLYFGAWQNGSVSLAGLPAGTYTVRFDSFDASGAVVNSPANLNGDCQVVVGGGGGGALSVQCGSFNGTNYSWTVTGSNAAVAQLQARVSNSLGGPWTAIYNGPPVSGSAPVPGTVAGQVKYVRFDAIDANNVVVLPNPIADCQFTP
jgi:hypothetical protein